MAKVGDFMCGGMFWEKHRLGLTDGAITVKVNVQIFALSVLIQSTFKNFYIKQKWKEI